MGGRGSIQQDQESWHLVGLRSMLLNALARIEGNLTSMYSTTGTSSGRLMRVQR